MKKKKSKIKKVFKWIANNKDELFDILKNIIDITEGKKKKKKK